MLATGRWRLVLGVVGGALSSALNAWCRPRWVLGAQTEPRCGDYPPLNTAPRLLRGPWALEWSWGVMTGLGWRLVFFDLFRLPFLPWIAVVGIGYVIGEGISASINRKRGRYLQYVARASVALSYMVAGLVRPQEFAFTFPDIFFW